MIKNKDKLINNSLDSRVKRAKADIINTIEYTLDKINAKNAVAENIHRVQKFINDKQINNIYLISIGKAAVPMTEGLSGYLKIKDGVVVTNKECKNLKIKCIESSHPIPSEKSIEAAKEVLKIITKATQNDLIVFLISGGGSALIELPRTDLEDFKKTTDILIKHSLSINEINCIRKHLSAIKGGQLIKNTKANIFSLVVSDVVKDDLSVIASGLTYYDNTTFKDAIDILNKHALENKLPESALNFLKKSDKKFETLKKDTFPFDRVENIIISSSAVALSYAEKYLLERDEKIYVLKDVTGDIHQAAESIESLIKKAKKNSGKPTAIIGAGEVSIDVKGSGKGGRNQHLALILAEKIKDVDCVLATFATDGKDGNSNAAGAIIDKYTVSKAETLGLDITKYRNNYDSNTFFKQLNDCILTDETNTNVADLFLGIVF